MEQRFLGIDLGTSEAKAVLIDGSGQVLLQESAPYRPMAPRPGWMEIEPEVWFQAVTSCLRRLLRQSDPASVCAIGLTGQMHSTVFLDEAARPVRPAILWNDLRSADLVPPLKRALAAAGQLPQIEKILAAGSPAASLLWLKKNEPASFARLDQFVIGPGYLAARLTGHFVTDYTLASTSSLYDAERRQWAPFMQELLGLPQRIFPQVLGSAQPAGTLLPEVADWLGLNPAIPVLVGVGDNPAAALAAGIASDGEPLLSLGTAGVYTVLHKGTIAPQKGKPILFSADGRQFVSLVQGTIDSCATCLNWLLGTVFEGGDFAAFEASIDPRQPGAPGLLFYPHFQGDKTVHADSGLRGAFFGLSAGISRVDLYRAVLEGICFAVRQLRDTLGLAPGLNVPLKTIGGGSKSRVWMQLLADILEQPVAVMGRGVSAAVGAASLAVGLSQRPATPQRIFSPNPAMASHYRQAYGHYLRIYGVLQEISGKK